MIIKFERILKRILIYILICSSVDAAQVRYYVHVFRSTASSDVLNYRYRYSGSSWDSLDCGAGENSEQHFALDTHLVYSVPRSQAIKTMECNLSVSPYTQLQQVGGAYVSSDSGSIDQEYSNGALITISDNSDHYNVHYYFYEEGVPIVGPDSDNDGIPDDEDPFPDPDIDYIVQVFLNPYNESYEVQIQTSDGLTQSFDVPPGGADISFQTPPNSAFTYLYPSGFDPFELTDSDPTYNQQSSDGGDGGSFPQTGNGSPSLQTPNADPDSIGSGTSGSSDPNVLAEIDYIEMRNAVQSALDRQGMDSDVLKGVVSYGVKDGTKPLLNSLNEISGRLDRNISDIADPITDISQISQSILDQLESEGISSSQALSYLNDIGVTLSDLKELESSLNAETVAVLESIDSKLGVSNDVPVMVNITNDFEQIDQTLNGISNLLGVAFTGNSNEYSYVDNSADIDSSEFENTNQSNIDSINEMNVSTHLKAFADGMRSKMISMFTIDFPNLGQSSVISFELPSLLGLQLPPLQIDTSENEFLVMLRHILVICLGISAIRYCMSVFNTTFQ